MNYDTVATRPGTNPGTGTGYPPTALATVGPYGLPVPGVVPGRVLPPAVSESGAEGAGEGGAGVDGRFAGKSRLDLLGLLDD